MQISTTSSMSNRDGNKGGWGGDLNPCFCLPVMGMIMILCVFSVKKNPFSIPDCGDFFHLCSHPFSRFYRRILSPLGLGRPKLG